MTTQTPTRKTLSEIKAQIERIGIVQIFHTEKGIMAFTEAYKNDGVTKLYGISKESKWNHELTKFYTDKVKFYNAIERHIKGQA